MISDNIIYKLKKIKGGTVGIWKEQFTQDELQEIVNNTFIDNVDNISLSELRYICINNIQTEPMCPVCNCKLPFKHSKFSIFCSNNCRRSEKGIEIYSGHMKNALLSKYGVEYISQLQSTQDKIKLTSVEKYGVSHFTQSEEVKYKAKNTNIERYGVESVLQSEDIKDKIKNTNIERYGVENVYQSEEIKDKIKNTNLEKYGESSYTKTDKFKEQVKKTNLEKYGESSYSKTDECKEQTKKTNLEKYDVEFTSQSPIVREKIVNTFIEKYGVNTPSKSKDIISKIQRTQRFNYWDTFLQVLGEKYITPKFNKIEYLDMDYDVSDKEYVCDKCGKTFKMDTLHAQVVHCPYHKYSSKAEYEIQQWLLSIDPSLEILMNNRFNKDGKSLELDLYLPDLKIGIEHHGLYWHNEEKHGKKYHKEKYLFFKDMGIDVIQVFENEWVNSKDIVKSIIKTKMGKVNRRIYARKCVINLIGNDEYREFTEQNHLQGFGLAKIRIGLFYDGELVQVMSFSKPRFTKHYEWENIRTCTKLDVLVIGGFSKILKFFTNNYNGSIISYVDVRYFTGKGYIFNGFVEKEHSFPNYFYFKKGVLKVEPRVKYQKHKLKNVLDVFDPNMTEIENMRNNDFYRIYDAGNLVLILEKIGGYTNHNADLMSFI